MKEASAFVYEAYDKYHREITRKDLLSEQLIKEKRKRKRLKRLNIYCEQALLVAQEVAQMTQEQLEYQVSSLVTSALKAIFPDPYKFKVEFIIKRGKTEADMFFSKDGEAVDPLTASGGGVVDIASFALRLTSYLIAKEKPAPVLLLDEPFRFVSEEYQEDVAVLLEELSTKFGVQIIIVTHEKTLCIGNVIQI